MQLTSNARYHTPGAIGPSCSLYVVDEMLRIVLTGSGPWDLTEPGPGARELPLELRAALGSVVASHDFGRESIAQGTLGNGLGVRCMRTAGRAGTFFMVMTQPLEQLFDAVA